MTNDTGESGWQRFKDWLNRQWGNAGDRDSEASSPTVERSDPPLPERVATWEDEGGSPAGTVTSVPVPPLDPKHG